MGRMNIVGLGLQVCCCVRAAGYKRRVFRPGHDIVAMMLLDVMYGEMCGIVEKPIKAIRAVNHAVRQSPGSGPIVLLQDRIAEELGIRAKG